ncbi:porin family protein [Vibrio vulnificus]|nr:porin family protein [Vibrio vulnificus]
MKMKAITLTLLSLSAISAAHADTKVNGFYLGAGAGSTEFDSDQSVTGKADGNALKLIAGYQFNRIVGIEAQYSKYGDVKFSTPQNTWTPTALSLNANLGYTFANGLRPYGIVGLSALDLSESTKTLESDSGAAIHFGLGLEYAPPALNGLAFRVGYDTEIFGISTEYDLNGTKVTEDVAYSLGAFYAGATYKF